jgi:hypothetical protein
MHRVHVGHVGLDGDGPAPVGLDVARHGFQGADVPGAQHDGRASRRERLGGDGADAPAGPGYQRDPALHGLITHGFSSDH